MRSNMPVEITGLSSTKTSACVSSCASTLPRLRKRVFRLITRSSRSESIGGLVTWLKFCRKKCESGRYWSRQHGERRVVAHRADGFLAVLHHRMKDQLEIFERRSGGDLAAAQFVRGRSSARLGPGADDRLQLDDLLRPFLVGMFVREFVLDRAVFVEAAFREIDRDHLAGTDAALAHDLATRRARPCRSRSRRTASRPR